MLVLDDGTFYFRPNVVLRYWWSVGILTNVTSLRRYFWTAQRWQNLRVTINNNNCLRRLCTEKTTKYRQALGEQMRLNPKTFDQWNPSGFADPRDGNGCMFPPPGGVRTECLPTFTPWMATASQNICASSKSGRVTLSRRHTVNGDDSILCNV